MVQASTIRQIKSPDSQGMQRIFSDLGFDESYLLLKVRGYIHGLRGFVLFSTVHVTRIIPEFAGGNSGIFGASVSYNHHLERSFSVQQSCYNWREFPRSLGDAEAVDLWQLEWPHECIMLLCSYVMLSESFGGAFWPTSLFEGKVLSAFHFLI